MCDPISIGIGILGSAAITKYQTDKQEDAMRKQSAEAKRVRKQQQDRFDTESAAASAIPTLLRNETQKSGGKTLASLKAKKSGGMGSGYNSVGTGGATATGLNIPK